MFVYVIVCSETLKLYIGQHKKENLGKYLSQKFYDARRFGNRSHLYNAMRKYPRASWSIWSLVSGIESKQELDETEQLLIYALKAQHPDVGYNICDGGEGFTGPHTDETKRRLRETHLGHELTEETRRKISEHTGHKPPGFGETIRTALIGRTWTPEQRDKIPAAISEAISNGRMKVHQWTPEERDRQRVAVSVVTKNRHLENFLKTVAWG